MLGSLRRFDKPLMEVALSSLNAAYYKLRGGLEGNIFAKSLCLERVGRRCRGGSAKEGAVRAREEALRDFHCQPTKGHGSPSFSLL